MNIKEIKQMKKKLISSSNPEWQNILKLRISVQKDFNNNHFLTVSTFDKILDWKLNQQKSQISKIKNSAPNSLIRTITNCYYKVDHPDDEMKTRIKMGILLSIPWIGIGISSAIITFHEPQLYGNVDFRSWSVLFNKDKKTFSGNDYLTYLKSIRELADKAGCDVQEIDYILWKNYKD